MPNARVVKPLFNRPDRSPNGITTNYREDIKGLFGQPDPTQWHVWFEDFDYAAATTKWVPQLVGAGSVNAVTTGLDGGQNTITNSAAGNDLTANTALAATFLPASNRSLIAECKFEVDDATNAHFGFALCPANVNPFTYSEGIAIRKILSANTFTIEVKKAGTTAATLAFNGVGLVANTQVTVGFAYKGPGPSFGTNALGQEFLFKLDLNDGNGPRYQSLFVPTANIPTNLLAPSWGVLNSTAVARTAKVDYVFAAKDRFYQ
jgi:hypothetical protein